MFHRSSFSILYKIIRFDICIDFAMTVAALLFADSFPIAITDSLISSKMESAHESLSPIDTPLKSDECRPGFDDYVPSGLAMKLWKLSENTSLLYAGVIKHAELLGEHIKHKTTYADYSNDVHKDVTDFAKREGLQVSFIVALRSGRDNQEFFWYGESMHESKLFGQIVSIGSGKSPMLDILSKTPAKPLPSPNEAPIEFMESAIVNALQAVAVLSRDYMDPISKMADKSTGGLFNVAHFPELYGYNDKATAPALVVSGLCQILIQLRSGVPVLSRVSISQQEFQNEEIDVLLFDDEQPISACNTELEIPAEKLGRITIGVTRLRSMPRTKYTPGAQLAIHQAIIYVESTEKCRHGAKPRTHKIYACIGKPVVKVDQQETGIKLMFDEPIISSVIKSLSTVIDPRSQDPYCPICFKTESIRAIIIEGGFPLIINTLLDAENQKPLEAFLDNLVMDPDLLEWWLINSKVYNSKLLNRPD